jgi:sugar phosphate isomerase/epimerase
MRILTRRHVLAVPALRPLLRAASLAKFPLGVTTDEIDDDVETAARFLEEFKLHWAEVRNIWGKYNTVQPLDQVREAKAILDRHKVKVNVLGTGFFKIPLPDDSPKGRGILDNQWALLDSAFERAKIFGTDKIRIFAFTYQGADQPERGHYPRIYELVREAADRARQRGFRLAVENVGNSYVWTGEQAGRLLKHVQHPNLGLTWDPNNAGAAGERSYPEGYKHLDPARIFHVHLRDFKKVGDKWEWAAVGDGVMDNAGQIRSLLKSGYKDSFTLETHYKSPQGKAHATRTSLAGLLKVIEGV